jgi:hypothetical protein
MSYEFHNILYRTAEAALKGVAAAWIYGSMDRPYDETLEDSPSELAAECIKFWDLGPLLAKWGMDAAALTAAMTNVLEDARALKAERDDYGKCM